MIRKRPEQPIDFDELTRAAETIRVLAHPHRLMIVDLLLLERRCVGDLAEAVALPQAAVSQHLNHMKAHGILDVQREGRSAYYYVISPHARQLLTCIRENNPCRPRK